MSKIVRKPRAAYGMECWEEPHSGERCVLLTTPPRWATAREARGRARWLTRAAWWIEAGNG